jgi:TonB family protein
MTKLDEYFDRARRAEPPLKKDDVSSILHEKLAARTTSDDAHRRLGTTFFRSAGRIFSLLSPKGWIMFSMLTSAVVAIVLLLPTTSRNTRIQEASKNNAPPTTATNHVTKPQVNTPQAASKQVNKTQVTNNQAIKAQAATINDSLPAPYDFIPADAEPFVDIKTLAKNVVYPEAAKKANLEGKVYVRVLVMSDGTASPKSFVEFTDAELFNPVALNAVHSATYTPAKREGKPIACWVTVPIVFRLRDRVGTNAVKKAQMLTLTAEELKKIGVEQDTSGILQVLGWNRAQSKLYQMQVSIHAGLKKNMMGSDSLFKAYLTTLRNDGKYESAAGWEKLQQENAKRSLIDLMQDSAMNTNSVGMTNLVTTKPPKVIPQYADIRQAARQCWFPRLVTDGHNYRYVLDISDLPHLQKMRESRVKADDFLKKAKELGLDSAQARDSIRKIFAQYSTNITESHAQEAAFAQEKTDISKLIGIRVPSKQARSEGDEYLLWYDPTSEFIALLPERYRVELGREVEAAKKYATKCEIPTEEEKKAVPGYFDSWRSCDGTLKITSIFPNPADVKATVRFTLQEARSITITVHNLNGERLAILEPTPVLPAGEHELPLDFTGRNIGVYLLALSTDKNETAVKRVMVVR